MSNAIDISGLTFGRLTVLARAGSRNGKAYWTCRCECGETVTLSGNRIRSPAAVTRGCKPPPKAQPKRTGPPKRWVSHGLSRTPAYQSWKGMMTRCYNTNKREYPEYGGRGITVCDEWRASFRAFHEHVGPRPDRSYSIDRIDNNRGYEPGNVRWATKTEQARNQRRVLTSDAVAKIKAELASGCERTELSRKFSVSTTTIRDIATGRRWADILPISTKPEAGK